MVIRNHQTYQLGKPLHLLPAVLWNSAKITRPLRSAPAADKLEHDLPPVRPSTMLGDVDALPGAERKSPGAAPAPAARPPVNMVFTCAGMSSGPSTSCNPSGVFGRNPRSAVARSARTSGSAFSWMTSEAEVCRRNKKRAAVFRSCLGEKACRVLRDLGEAFARASPPRGCCQLSSRAHADNSR